MDPAADEQLDYGEEEYRGVEKIHYQGGGAIPALADEELMGEDDEYEDLYNDVNVGEGFLQLHQSEHLGSSSSVGNGGLQGHISNVPEARREAGVSQGITNPAVAVDRKYQNASSSLPEQKEGFMAVNGPERVPINQIDGPLDSLKGTQDALAGNMVFQGPTSVSSKTVFDAVDNGKVAGTGIGSSKVMQEMPRIQMAVTDNVNVAHPMVSESLIRPSVENGSTTLYVGELHWWTTDAEIESVLSQYGRVREIKFFDERASGKSKGYCQVEFYESIAAAACKEKVNGYEFNGRACVVAFASPQTLRQMGAAYMNKTQAQPPVQNQGRRIMNDGAGRSGGMNYQSGDAGRNYGRGGWGGRGGQGILNRGPGGGGGPRGRGPMAVKSSVGNATGVNAGPAAVNFGQGLPGPAFGGPAGGMMHSQSMMGPGFDPTFMGRGAGYGGFSGPPFPGLMSPFPAVNAMGFAGVAPHVNPAFFGRGMTPNGMGMMSNNGMDGHPRGIWPPEPSMGGWVGEEHGRRTRESSYGGDDGASEYGYGEENPEKGGRSNVTSRERERASERDWSENSERRHRDEREQGWDRSDRERRYREEKDSYRDIQQKKRDLGYEVDRDREQASSRPRSRSRAVPEEDHRSRSRDMDYGKRRHAPSE